MSESMKLPAGKICGDCVNVYRCTNIFGVKSENEFCDFYPIRFIDRAKLQAKVEEHNRRER